MFNKKIAFVITAQHCIPHGGIGQFCKSFVDMAKELNWAVHVILDKAPARSSLTQYLDECDNVSVYCTATMYGYAEHNNTFVFEDAMNFERMVNVRDNMMLALQDNIYDMVIVNSPDAASPIYNLNLGKYVPVIFYTHSENFIFLDNGANRVFSDSCVDYMQNLLRLKYFTIGTQTALNVKHIKQNFDVDAVSLPMRVPELDLLNWKIAERDGMLFTGRWEPRKNPQVFCDAAIEMGVKAKVLTNTKGAEKFAKYFESKGYTNYEIKSSIIGQEKVDFIRSAKIAFHPAKLESFGFSAFESAHTCPTFCLEEYGWWKNFEGLVKPLKGDYVTELKAVYEETDMDYARRIHLLQAMDGLTKNLWEQFAHRDYDNQSTVENSVTKNLSDNSISVSHLYTNILKRKKAAIDDVASVYKKANSIKLFHELEDTYIGKAGSEFNPDLEKNNSLEDLFS